MAKGQSVPGNVGYFGDKAQSSKGKAHPSKIAPGLATTKVYNKTSGPTKAASASARATQPAGVKRGDGTETRKGTDVKHLNAPPNKQVKGEGQSMPAGVRKHTGLSAPKRIK